MRLMRLPIVSLAALCALAGPVRAAEPASPIVVTTVDYRVPALTLTREDGATVSLPKELDDGRPVAVNFIFTTCAAICPLLTQTFATFQKRLGRDAAHLHLVSFSIDPEQDTPERLRQYAAKFKAGPGWNWYTGTAAASVAVQKAFDVYRGDKMAHGAVMLMRARPGAPWRRVEGFATADDLVREYRAMTGRH
jgi:protein SCO1/2